MTSYIREYGPKLVEKGYLVCDIAPGKKAPMRKNWTQNPLTAQACRQHNPNEGVGILCGQGEFPICGIDVDFEGTEEQSQELFDRLTRANVELMLAPKRVGKPGRFLLICRSAEPWTKSTTDYFGQDGEKASRMEILGRGQQFVAYHIHPGTGKPYTYPDTMISGEPTDIAAGALPVLTKEDVDQLKDVFVSYMKEIGYTRTSDNAIPLCNAADIDWEALSPKRPIGLSIEDIRMVFEKSEWDWESYDKWRDAGMRIHHETEGSAEGLALWDELSQRATNYGGFDVCERKWESFHCSLGGRAVSMWPLAKSVGILSARASELSEAGLMYRALRDFGDRLRYITDTKTWLYFNPETNLWEGYKSESLLWKEVMEHVIYGSLTEEATNESDEERAKAIKVFQTKCKQNLYNTMTKTINLLSKCEEVQGKLSEFDKDSSVIALRNGLVELYSGRLLENSPERMMARYCNFDYDPEAKCPMWERAVADWFEGPEVAAYMQKVLGKMMVGAPEDDAFYILVGEGANGKSSFIDTVRNVMGGYAKAVAENTIMGNSSATSGAARADLYGLQGVRFAYCSETGDRSVLKVSDVKRFTGRDVVTARALYGKNEEEFIPQFTLFVATNYEPKLPGAENAIRRRIRIIRFPKDYEYDPTMRAKRIDNLDKKLEAELPGIFNWCLAGYHRALKEGLEVPDSVAAASDAYVDSQDLVARWFAENCVASEKGKMPVKDAFNAFRTMLEAENEREWGYNQTAFTTRLKRVLERKGRKHAIKKSNGRNTLYGYELRKPSDDEDDDFVLP